MNPNTDTRTVLTLDAGGTNFVFSAIRANREVVSPVTLPSNGNDLEKCITTIENGFRSVMSVLDRKPAAVSFAFPGPSDYRSGIIGKLNNLPAFTGAVPLGPILEHRLALPVFINNDGDLYAYGEALSGFLPYVNEMLGKAGIKKQFRNLIGVTLGTGFGGGLVRNEELIAGDNSMAGEIWLLRNRINPGTNAEEGISIRAVQRVYTGQSDSSDSETLSPKDIFEIATGKKEGDRAAAGEAFRQLGIVLGDALGNLLTAFDGAVVIGGGLSGAESLFIPALLKELKATYTSYEGKAYSRLVQKVYYMNDAFEQNDFLDWKETEVTVPGTGKKISFYSEARIPLGVSMIGTSRAVSLGAYAYALKMIDKV